MILPYMRIELRGLRRKVSNPPLCLAAVFLALSMAPSLTKTGWAAMTSEVSGTPGALVHDVLRPDTAGWTHVCSNRHPACVHADPAAAANPTEASAPPARAGDALAAAPDYPGP